MPFGPQWFEAHFGSGYGSIATVGYRLVQANGSDSVARTTTGVIELTAGTGNYGVTVASVPDNAVAIEWDTGGGSPVYASQGINDFSIPENVMRYQRS